VLALIVGNCSGRDVRRHAAMVSLITDPRIHQWGPLRRMTEPISVCLKGVNHFYVSSWQRITANLRPRIHAESPMPKLSLGEALPSDLLNLIYRFQHDVAEDSSRSRHQKRAVAAQTHFDMCNVQFGHFNSRGVSLLV
jgi:hypothetical protein